MVPPTSKAIAKKSRSLLRENTNLAIAEARQTLDTHPPASAIQLEAQLGIIQSLRTDLKAAEVEVLNSLDSEAEVEAELTQSNTFDLSLRKIIHELGARVNSAYRAASAAASSTAKGSVNSDSSTVGPRLPKLELTKFSGDPIGWVPFWDDFRGSVHDRPDLSAVTKFKYLRGCLEGEAWETVKGFELTENNYTEVIGLLKDRFGDEQLAIFAHFQTLLNLPSATTNHISQLRQVYDQCETHFRSLVALGCDEQTFSVVFIPILLWKLPKFVNIDLQRANGGRRWTLDNLRKLLREEISARDRGERTFGGNNQSTNKGSSSKLKAEVPHAASSLLTTADKPSSPKPLGGGKPKQGRYNRKLTCVFCSKDHYSDQCKVYVDVQMRLAQLGERCQRCFSQQHKAGTCNVNRPCYYCKATNHHRALCPQQFPTKVTTALSTHTLNTNAAEFKPRIYTLGVQSGNQMAVMLTAKAPLVGLHGTVEGRILFDPGSTRSFITKEKARELGAQRVDWETSSVGRFKETKRKTTTHEVVEVGVQLLSGKRITLRLCVVEAISTPIQLYPFDRTDDAFSGIELAEPPVDVPTLVTLDLLLGLDYYYTFVGSEQRRSASSGIVLTGSSLGWIAGGTVESELPQTHTVFLITQSQDPESLFNLERYWSLEDIGVKDKLSHFDDSIAVQKFHESVQHSNSRYYVKWPWKTEKPDISSNYGLALGRLKSLYKRLQDTPEVMANYTAKLVEQVAMGIIEEAPEVPTGLVHYIPHHCVLTPWKVTTKLRIVYDASAKCPVSKQSINDCMYRGPVIMSDLCGMLFRFRLHSMALVSDIEKAFQQVILQEAERDVTRFLWLKDIAKPPTLDNIQIMRFVGVPFGFIASPFLLGATITHLLKSSPGFVADQILDNLYVDNILSGAENLVDAQRFYEQAVDIFAKGASMNLREWFSNSKEFMGSVREEHRGKGSNTSVLGLKWDLEADSLTCSVGREMAPITLTKRQVLSAVASVYDPCGFFAPVTLIGRLLMQMLWKKQLEWDETLPSDLLAQWLKYKDDLLTIPQVSIPRQLSQSVHSPGALLELHCFADASARAYSAAVYLRICGPIHITSDLMFCRLRVSPIKPLTIPRLELMAFLVGARLIKFVRSELRLPVQSSTIWGDNMAVLHWVTGERSKEVFVRNRVSEINSIEGLKFRYVATEHNPADLPTRGMSVSELSKSELWWHGPSWLALPESEWPQQPSLSEIDNPEVGEDRVTVNAVVAKPDTCPIPLSHFSQLNRLLRVTAYVFRLSVSKAERTQGQVTASEMQSALNFWVQHVQSLFFGSLFKSNPTPEDRRLKLELGIFVDSLAILRCRGRYGHSDLSPQTKEPILLPKGSHFTTLVIKQTHAQLLHRGVKHTLAQLRQQYWVPQGRKTVKGVLDKCMLCKRYRGGPFRVPDPPPLPDFRVTMQRPFACVGLDYLGPVYVSNSSQPASKVWICIFTCAVIRAVHLEVVTDLSACQFLLCFRRFIAICGRPTLVVSDNATQFHLSEKVIAKLWIEVLRDDEVQNFSTAQGIAWKFITELAPWMGGFYERLVAPVKSALKLTLHRSRVTLVELQTVVSEVSAVLNSRPLTYVSGEVDDKPLTPNDLMWRSNELFPSVDTEIKYVPEPTTATGLVVQWKTVQKVIDGFWERWHKDYLVSLRERYVQIRQRNTSDMLPLIGTVVTIQEDKVPRGVWRMGRITRLITSGDGKCRSAEVLLPGGRCLVRAIKHLYPLEFSEEPVGQKLSSDTATAAQPVGTVARRPTRSAAARVRQLVRHQLASGSDSDSE